MDPFRLGFFTWTKELREEIAKRKKLDESIKGDGDEPMDERHDSEEEEEEEEECDLEEYKPVKEEDTTRSTNRISIDNRLMAKYPPIIRMVFAAGSQSPHVKIPGPSPRKSPRTKTGNFVSYDFWFAGSTAKTFGCINEEQQSSYQAILSPPQTKTAYDSGYKPNIANATSLTRMMNPGAHTDPAHWNLLKMLSQPHDPQLI